MGEVFYPAVLYVLWVDYKLGVWVMGMGICMCVLPVNSIGVLWYMNTNFSRLN